MAVETSTERPTPPAGNVRRAKDDKALLPGERVVSELESTDAGSFVLTHARVIFRGDSDSNSVLSSVQLKDISSIEISRRPRARRSAAWGIVGLFAAIGVWQVTPSSTVGLTSAIAVAIVSILLMADYWIRPAGVHMELHTSGGKVLGGEVGGRASSAVEFTREVENAKRRLVPNRTSSPYRNYPSGS